jgi:hypothetical protein
MVTTIAWSRFTSVCDNCHWRFRIDKATLDEHRADLSGDLGGTATDEDVAAVITICHRCVWGEEGVGEFIHENPAARRWDPKGWALDTLAALAREVVKHLDQGARDGDPELAEVRLRRRAFVAKELRARIDGRY